MPAGSSDGVKATHRGLAAQARAVAHLRGPSKESKAQALVRLKLREADVTLKPWKSPELGYERAVPEQAGAPDDIADVGGHEAVPRGDLRVTEVLKFDGDERGPLPGRQLVDRLEDGIPQRVRHDAPLGRDELCLGGPRAMLGKVTWVNPGIEARLIERDDVLVTTATKVINDAVIGDGEEKRDAKIVGLSARVTQHSSDRLCGAGEQIGGLIDLATPTKSGETSPNSTHEPTLEDAEDERGEGLRAVAQAEAAVDDPLEVHGGVGVRLGERAQGQA